MFYDPWDSFTASWIGQISNQRLEKVAGQKSLMLEISGMCEFDCTYATRPNLQLLVAEISGTTLRLLGKLTAQG